jgi:hypothetical protein
MIEDMEFLNKIGLEKHFLTEEEMLQGFSTPERKFPSRITEDLPPPNSVSNTPQGTFDTFSFTSTPFQMLFDGNAGDHEMPQDLAIFPNSSFSSHQ